MENSEARRHKIAILDVRGYLPKRITYLQINPLKNERETAHCASERLSDKLKSN
jgi:hypothetical protein